MKNTQYTLIIIFLAFQLSCVSLAQQQICEQTKAERKSFQKSSYVIKAPTESQMRELKNGKSYDPKPKVIVMDEKTGKYEFRWIGTDGKEKVVAYQRHDAIEAMLEAKTEKNQDGKFLYKYYLKILPTSPIYFRGFVVQTFTQDSKPIELNDSRFYIGQKSNLGYLYKDGTWWSYAFVGEENQRIQGNNVIEFQLTSSSPPGLVNCKAIGGELGTKGVGEHIPSFLEDEIPIFEDLAWGYTIGPIESLSTLSKSERAKYLLDNLPKFQEAGWMSEGTAKNYEAILKREDLAGALEKAKKDLENEFITSEVFQIIEGLNQ